VLAVCVAGHSILQHTWILLAATMANLFVLMWSFGFFQVHHMGKLCCSSITAEMR
jgi:hypothetical protein